MRRDMTELKKLVNTLMAERGAASVSTAQPVGYYQAPSYDLAHAMTASPAINISPVKHSGMGKNDDDIQDTEEYVEETPQSLVEVEKDMIRKALERHHGKRKNAAKDLKISERTLYRKIKEYDLE